MLKRYVNTYLRIKYKTINVSSGIFKKCLNVGCGNDLRMFWKNCDLSAHSSSIIKFDAKSKDDLLWLRNQKFDIINSDHMIGYLNLGQATQFFAACYDALQPSGKLILEFPDFNKISKKLNNMDYNSSTAEEEYVEIVRAVYAYNSEDAYSLNFDIPTYITAWTPEIISLILKKVGFNSITHGDPLTHGQRNERDTRICALK